jgi:hypothetical protein
MRGKAIGCADRPVVPASRWTGWRPRRPRSSRPLDRVRKAPGIGPHRADLARCCAQARLAPLRTLSPLASYRARLAPAIGAPSVPNRPRWTHLPDGAQGGLEGCALRASAACDSPAAPACLSCLDLGPNSAVHISLGHPSQAGALPVPLINCDHPALLLISRIGGYAPCPSG